MKSYFRTLISICYLAISIAFGSFNVYGQPATVEMAAVDSFNYVFPPSSRPNQLADSLKSKLILQGGASVQELILINEEIKEVLDINSEHSFKKNNRPGWVLVVTFMIFLALGLIRYFFPSDFHNIFKAFYDERALMQISREDNVATSWSYIFLYIVFSLSLALLILLYQSKNSPYLLTLENFLGLSLFIGVFFVFKILTLRVLGFIFKILRLVREYITVLYLIYFNTMFFGTILLLLAVFFPYQFYNQLFILGVIIVVLLAAYRIIRTALHLLNQVGFSIFYFILYLCTLEIAPVLLLIKVLRV